MPLEAHSFISAPSAFSAVNTFLRFRCWNTSNWLPGCSAPSFSGDGPLAAERLQGGHAQGS